MLMIITGCTNKAISIFTDYVTEENLASYQVGTPDPALNCPPFGQRLFLSWSLKHLPEAYQIYSDLRIRLIIRFKNREEITKEIRLLRPSGTYMFTLMNEEYCEKRGIASYKAILYGDDCPLEEWRHQLWAELIKVDVVD